MRRAVEPSGEEKKPTALARVERLVEAIFGKGSAVSLDRRQGLWVATAWTPDGVGGCEVGSPSKREALRELARVLKESIEG